jgi:hypothetical protein
MKTEDRGLRMEDGKAGSAEKAMDKGQSERAGIVQSPSSKVQSRIDRGDEEAEFEVLRLKTTFRVGDTLKGGHRTGKVRLLTRLCFAAARQASEATFEPHNLKNTNP